MARWGTDLDMIYRVTKTQATPGFGCAKAPFLHMERNGEVSSFIHTGVAPTRWLFYGITIFKWAMVQEARIMTNPNRYSTIWQEVDENCSYFINY